MSKPNPITEAEGELSALLTQQADLEKKLAGLQKQAAAWGDDFTNLDQAVNEIGKNAAQAEAINQALIMLLPRIDLARGKVEAVKKADRLAQAAAFEPILDQALKGVVQAVLNLNQALGDLDRVGNDYRFITGYYPSTKHLPNELRKAVKLTIETLAHDRPELLGLPPSPSPAELRKMEAREKLARMKSRLESVKGYNDDLRGSRDYEDSLDLAQADYSKAKKEFEALN